MNRIIEMVSFEPSKEIEEDVFRFVTSLVAHRRVSSSVAEHRKAESEGLRFDSEFFLCPTLMTRRKTSLSILLFF